MKKGKLSGRVALVTGGSRGIGKAVCVAFGNEGASVAVQYNRGDEIVSRVRGAFGPVDILVNNAGEMTDCPVEGMSDGMWEESILINLTAAFRCARAYSASPTRSPRSSACSL